MKRIGTMIMREILFCRQWADLTRAEAAAALGVSEGTVTNVEKRALAAGLSWPLLDDLGDAELQARLYPPRAAAEDKRLPPDWDAVAQALAASRRPGQVRVTRHRLWLEYCAEASRRGRTSYSYSRFCGLLRAHLARPRGRTMPGFRASPG